MSRLAATVLSLALAAPLCAQSQHPFNYPPAPTSNDAVVYHGKTVPDPYRPLEDADAPASRAWIDAQNALTQDWLAGVRDRDAIKARLTEIWNYERFGVPFKQGGRYFYTRNDGLQNQSPIYVADSLDAQPRLLLDPNTLRDDGTVAVSGMSVTDDGEYLAYGLSEAGSDWVTWKVREVVSGKDLPDTVEWSKFSGAAWLKDGSGFFYTRYDKPRPGESLKGANFYPKVFFHRRGTDQADDPLIYSRDDEKEWGFSVAVTDDGRFAVMTVSKGTDPRNRVFVRDLQAFPPGALASPTDQPVVAAERAVRAAVESLEAAVARKAPDADLAAARRAVADARQRRADAIAAAGALSRGFLELLNDFDASYDFIDNDGRTLFFRTDLDAPRSRIIAIDLDRPRREHWRQVVPEADETLTAVTLVGDRFLASYLKDARTLVRVFELSGAHVRDVDLPGLGTAAGFGGKRADPETFYAFTGYTNPGAIYRYDAATGRSTVFRRPKVPFNPDDFETSQVFYTSRDGTRVPMFITARKGLARDGSSPTLLYGYGGFNIPLTPTFSPATMAWLDMGGVYAVANLRGGGEYGEQWHQAGTRTRKQNVFDDFIAAAEFLVRERYTSTSRLAIFGGSNGGLLVGACLNQRPDLFGAAIAAVGVMDMLRFHKFTIGHAWTADYGNPEENSDEFAAILKYSPYHNIKPDTCYPPVLVTTGDHDDRVFPAHSFKYAAALQAAQARVPGCANPILIRIETRAGHGAGKPTAKIIEERADMWAFLVRALRMTPSLPAAAGSGA
jgi:prolyl oligopeptidase